MGSWVGVGALLDWLELTLLDWLELVLLDWLEIALELDVARLVVPIVLALMDVLPETVADVELEVVVFVKLSEVVDDVRVGEDDTVDVRPVEEEDCVAVLLVVAIVLLLPDEVPLKLLDVVGTIEPLGRVEVGELVIVPLIVETVEDVETEVDEPLVEIDPVGPDDRELLVPLPYGAPLEKVLEENPLEAPVL